MSLMAGGKRFQIGAGMKNQFAFIDTAQRTDTRQQRGLAAEGTLERLADGARRTPGRQVDGRIRQRQRIVRGRKAGHQRAVDQARDQRLQKGRIGRDRIKARRFRHGHFPDGINRTRLALNDR